MDSSNVKYLHRVEDPWIAATTSIKAPPSIQSVIGITEYFVADDPVAVLGCATQKSYCNPTLLDSQQCMDNYSANASQAFTNLWQDPKEQAEMRALYAMLNAQSSSRPDVFYAASSLPSLITRFSLDGAVQPDAIPKNRWHEEVEYMFQANLVAMQSKMIEHARAQWSAWYLTACGFSVECHRVCHSQVSRSFSDLGTSMSSAHICRKSRVPNITPSVF